MYGNSGQVYLSCLYQAIFTAAYYGMLRIGEVTSGDHPVKAVDVHVAENKRKFLFILRTLKTHGLGNKPQMIKICGATGVRDQHCPFGILQQFVKVRPSRRNDSEPFFVFADRHPVNPGHARSVLKNVVRLLGLNNTLYSFHCFHSGRSTDLYEWGVPVSTIMKLGRWRANAVYKYLR